VGKDKNLGKQPSNGLVPEENSGNKITYSSVKKRIRNHFCIGGVAKVLGNRWLFALWGR